MAILDVEGLSLEIRYVSFDFYGDLYYEISLKFNGQSVINPELLKREPAAADQPGGIIVVNGPLCRLLPLLKDALENDKADFWEDNNLSVTLAVYPNDYSRSCRVTWFRSRARAKTKRHRKKHLPIPSRTTSTSSCSSIRSISEIETLHPR